MKVITVKQPWASLLVYGYKKYEFRSWKTNYRGEILIHAGLGIDKKAMEKFQDLPIPYPNGVIMGSVLLEDCLEIDEQLNEQILLENSKIYSCQPIGAYAFKISYPKLLKKPILIKGKLGIWNLEKTLAK